VASTASAATTMSPAASASTSTTDDEVEDVVEPKEPPQLHLRAVGPTAAANFSAEPPATAIAHCSADTQGRRQAPPGCRIRPSRRRIWTPVCRNHRQQPPP
jgi:hypothetical protein